MTRIASSLLYFLVSIFGGLTALWFATAFVAPSYSQSGGAPPAAPSAATAPAAAAPAAAPLPTKPVVVPPPAASTDIPASNTQTSVLEENFIYDPTGKRDPFHLEEEIKQKDDSSAPAPTQVTDTGEIIPTAPLESFDSSQYRVVAIIWDTKMPKALVQDPTGRIHSVRVQAKLGKLHGTIVAIREGEVVVAETNSGGARKYVILALKKGG